MAAKLPLKPDKGKPEVVADWSDSNTQIVCELFAEQVRIGNRQSTHLNNNGYDAVIKGFNERTGVEYTKKQLKNRWDKLRADWGIWKRLVGNRTTGLGWDPLKRTIVMDNEWWKKARVDIPGCIKFRKHGILNEDELRIMFEDITNDGSDHWSPYSGVPPQMGTNLSEPSIAIDVGDEDNIDDADYNEIHESPASAKGKRVLTSTTIVDKPKKPKPGGSQVMNDNLQKLSDLTERTQSTLESYDSIKKDDSCSIQKVMELVVECGASFGSDEHYIATDLFVKKEQREMFFTMPPEHRYAWLRRKYNDKHGH